MRQISQAEIVRVQARKSFLVKPVLKPALSWGRQIQLKRNQNILMAYSYFSPSILQSEFRTRNLMPISKNYVSETQHR